MFFVAFWGKKKTEKRLGFAADFCRVCRKISAFAVNRVGVAAHFYFVAVEEGCLAGHTQKCMTCGTSFDSHPSRFYRLAESADSSIDRLAHATFPSIYQDFAERLALEERIAADPHGLDAELRKKVLMEPFQLTSSYFENRRFETGLELLATTLRPLDPSEDEVRECLNHFRRIRARIGGMLKTATIMKKLRWKPSPHDYNY